ncbi:MAG: alpha/beta hydrolase [Clostridiales bacterium]|nr:alpha/beta hydrolase [Clostridiales bacterium]
MNAENDYLKYMEEQILPSILPHREELYLSREPGRNLYCAFYTADETVSAKGILLISHGFTETADKYFEVICYFLKAGFHVCILEHCGHGRSYRLAKEDLSLVHIDSWKRYVADLKFVARAAKKYYNKPLPLFLFAHSMGGGIGAALAAREPGLFERVILCSPMICPATGGVPMPLTQLIDAAMCKSGHERDYVIGQHAYDGQETFEDAFATSPSRWAWYKAKTDAEPLFQTSGASYGWLREAIRLNHFLMTEAWKRITAPILLFQAENETVVSKEQQVLFLQKLAQARQSDNIRFVQVPGAKHEIYRSEDETTARFLKTCLEFLEEDL